MAFDPDAFCTTVTDIARRMNARAGRWLGGSTRHDGVEVDCGLKMLETKRFLKADPDDMRERWEARQQRAWNAAYCNNEAWREAIDNGWSIRCAPNVDTYLDDAAFQPIDKGASPLGGSRTWHS